MADKGGGEVWTPPFLADIICEQPLTRIRELREKFSRKKHGKGSMLNTKDLTEKQLSKKLVV